MFSGCSLFLIGFTILSILGYEVMKFDGFAVVCVSFLVMLLTVSILGRRSYKKYLKEKGFWVGHQGRDSFYYEELHEGTSRKLTISGEMMGTGPINHLIYVPSEVEWSQKMPDWAKDRREEIIRRMKEFLGEERYKFEAD